jgi:hypothetical protein
MVEKSMQAKVKQLAIALLTLALASSGKFLWNK